MSERFSLQPTEIQSLNQKIRHIWLKAEKHRKASMVGTPAQDDLNQICRCCDQIVEKQPISIWEHTKELQMFGFGYPLWYSFLKYCILLIVVLIASKTATEMYMAINENYDFCYGNKVNQFIKNQDNKNERIAIRDKQQQNQAKVISQAIKPGTILSDQVQENGRVIGRRLLFNQDLGNLIVPTKDINLFQSAPTAQAAIGPSTLRLSYISSTALQADDIEDYSGGRSCTSFMVYYSIFKGQDMFENIYLKIIQFLVHLFFLVYIRNMILKEQQYYDERKTSISHYSILISNLPETQHGIRAMVLDMLENQFEKTYGEQYSSIYQVQYVFQDEELNRLTDQAGMLEKQLLDCLKQRYKQRNWDEQENGSGKELEFEKLQEQGLIRQRINQNEIEIYQCAKKIRRQMDEDQIKCNKVIVVFKTEYDKAQVLQQYSEGVSQGEQQRYQKYFQKSEVNSDQQQKMTQQPINIKEAPQPNEIIWKHINLSDSMRFRLIVRGYLLTFGFLSVVTVIFYFILLAKTQLVQRSLERENEEPRNPDYYFFESFAILLVFLAILGVILFNKFIMGKVMHKFVQLERHAYADKKTQSFSLKYALGMFFTTALMTLAVEAFTIGNFYQHPFGVIQEETIMFMVTAFFIPLIWIINPFALFKKWCLRKKYLTLVTQAEANELIQPFPYDLGKRYAEILQIMWFTFLYSELIPLGSFFTLIGLVLYFWIDKYNLLNRSTLKAGISGKMAIYGLKSLDATLFLSPAGAVLFELLIRKNFDWVSLIFTLIGLIYLCTPITKIIWKFNKQKYYIKQKPIQQTEYMFRKTYMNQQPVYIQTHKQQIRKHHQQVNGYYKQQVQVSQLFGAGRGTYIKKQSSFSKSSKNQKLQKSAYSIVVSVANKEIDQTEQIKESQ